MQNCFAIKGSLVDCYNDLCQEKFPKERWFQRRSHSIHPTRDATDVRHSWSEFSLNSASNMKEKNQNKYLVRTKSSIQHWLADTLR